MTRNASAVWRGDLKAGRGTLSTDSTVLKDTQYSFTSRFESGVGTNPEELIAAAHAGCFTMALAAALEKAGHVADTLSTSAAVTLENHPKTGWTLSAVHLTTSAKVPGIDPAAFAQVAAGAKANCPVSRVLNAAVTLDARLA
jgi:osmotically inducible protein OsmC